MISLLILLSIVSPVCAQATTTMCVYQSGPLALQLRNAVNCNSVKGPNMCAFDTCSNTNVVEQLAAGITSTSTSTSSYTVCGPAPCMRHGRYYTLGSGMVTCALQSGFGFGFRIDISIMIMISYSNVRVAIDITAGCHVARESVLRSRVLIANKNPWTNTAVLSRPAIENLMVIGTSELSHGIFSWLACIVFEFDVQHPGSALSKLLMSILDCSQHILKLLTFSDFPYQNSPRAPSVMLYMFEFGATILQLSAIMIGQLAMHMLMSSNLCAFTYTT